MGAKWDLALWFAGVAVLVLSGPLSAEDPYQVAWSRQIGTSTIDRSYSVAVDVFGNAYIGGITQGSLGGTSAGGVDNFLFKYDSDGNVLWSRQPGSTSSEYYGSVAVDSSGNAYLSGWTSGDLAADNAGGWDVFLVKYNSDGNVLWSRQTGSAGHDYVYAATVDALGNAYICGSTKGDLAATNAGYDDVLLIKYNSAGDLLWSRQIGTPEVDEGRGVAVDASGDVYVTGETSGNLARTRIGYDDDVFLLKYDPNGNLLWSRQTGTSEDDRGRSVAVDAPNNPLVSGYTLGSLGGPHLGHSDAFVIKYDASGNVIWSQQIGTS
ncbi:unnamed protein product, partial [marine sediment metagenome]